MNAQPLTQTLILLLASVLVVGLARRVRLPPLLGYLVVGMTLGPLALGLLPDSRATHALAEIGVVFLLFTLGLDFSWPRMRAMRREVFGLGFVQMSAVGGPAAVAAYAAGV
ncbi:MAG TPA: cation:proton antiporter, partial [Steroidobacteraceae bacterium]